jgi:hypothetical protein
MEHQYMWNSVRNELRELVWLTSMVTGLSMFGVGLAVAFEMVLVGTA